MKINQNQCILIKNQLRYILSFEKNNEELKTYEISSLEGSTFQFNDGSSNYTFDLSQETAIETGKSEIVLYLCEHTKFKM